MTRQKSSTVVRCAHGRRRFLRDMLWRGLDGLERFGHVFMGRHRLLAGRPSSGPGPDEAGPGRFLRPPGALPEVDFVGACSRCGHCVRACPAACIVVDPGVAGGLPHIVARQSPCVVCEDLSCMKACPTGALRPVDQVGQIDMGLAVVDHGRCLRQPDAGPSAGPHDDLDRECRLCIDNCPLGDAAMVIGPGGRIMVLPGCVGCGVCERVCPTEPASVVVTPAGRG